jgi:hypothetical protein
MNLPFKELPIEYNRYIRSDALDIIEEYRNKWTLSYHSLFRLPIHKLFTLEGILKFSDHAPLVDVFRVPPKFTTGIHVDKAISAVNFVVKGTGVMQWFHLTDLEVQHISEWGTQVYKPNMNYYAQTSCSVIEVNTQIPHRIVCTSDDERICISLRKLSKV